MFAAFGVTAIIQYLGKIEATSTNGALYAAISIVLIIAGIFAFKVYRSGLRKTSGGGEASGATIAGSDIKKGTGDAALDEAIGAVGYYYDPEQDIFYSTLYPWQRDMGYCRLYDEAAAPLGMIIDCEPIYFEYDDKRWLIEFWKGQYDMTTGCEIGVYATDGPDLDIAGIFKGRFYKSVSDEDLLQMFLSLEKNGETLFRREEKHWWLTGFKLGEFSDPSELTMYLSITLKDETMRNAFLEGLMKAGYSENEIYTDGNSVGLKFDKTHTPQPVTRTAETDWIIQRKNELLCNTYNDITGPYDNFPDKINAIKQQAPEIYDAIFNIGKTEKLFAVYEKIRDYLT